MNALKLTFDGNTVFMEIDGNDLAHEEEPEKLARDIASFADYVITVYDVSHVTVGQLLPRHSGSSGPKYNDKVNKVNQHLASLLKYRDTASLLLPFEMISRYIRFELPTAARTLFAYTCIPTSFK
jgi:hypothetical protein